MKCEKAREWMSREFDDALDERRIERLNEHLAVCADCRDMREKWLKLRSAWRSQQPAEIPSAEAIWADVRRAIRSTKPADLREPSEWWVALGLPRVLTAIAVFGLLLAVGLYHVWRQQPAQAATMATVVEFVETELPNAAPMVYQDNETGWTVIWVVEANHKESGHAGS